MNAKTILSKLTSVIASILLAIGGTLAATQPASADPGASAGSNSNSTIISVFWTACTSFSGSGSTSDFQVFKNGSQSPVSLVSVELPPGAGIVMITLPSAAVLNDTYQIVFDNTNSLIVCGGSGTTKPNSILDSDNVIATTVDVGQQPQVTLLSGPTFTLIDGVATKTPATWSSGSTNQSFWFVCDIAHDARSGPGNNQPADDCNLISATDSTDWISTTPFTIPASAWRRLTNSTRENITMAGKYLALYENNQMWALSATQKIAGGDAPVASQEVERYVAPAFQAPLFNSLVPQGIIGVSNNGGRLVLKDVKVTDIKSVTLNGTALTVVESKSGSAVKIPSGSKAGDLLFSMTDGTSITVPNAVKLNPSQVDEKLVDLVNLPKFTDSSAAVPAAITKALNKASALIKSSQSAKCVGYAATNTAKAKATALARATNVCSAINNLNESIEPIIKVVVNKTIAKKSAVRYLTW